MKKNLIKDNLKDQLRHRIKQPYEEPAKIVFILRHKMNREY